MSILLYVPFLGIILSIALMPLWAPKLWHMHYGKIAAGWLCAGIASTVHFYSIETAIHDITHTVLLDYVPFICVVLALYTISGGLRLHVHAKPTPLVNTLFLGLGSLFASVVGTTGASIILIRPFLKLNHHRQNRVHQVIFFIFLVSNIGGTLTPLGDPPLFMGFLKGVDFFWTLRMLWPPYTLTLGILLAVFYVLDSKWCEPEFKSGEDQRIQVQMEGGMHLFLLAGVVALVLCSGFWKPEAYINVLGVELALQNITRDIGMVGMAVLSLLFTPMRIRHGHEFHWEPFWEVAKLFLAIFITLAPVIKGIQAWGESATTGMTPHLYFWLTGSLSSFLDNAPTYLVFFNMAGGYPQELMTSKAHILQAISLGAVFMGAMSYIGNAPNFMVASIARNYQIKMPSFFGYMAWSMLILFPILWIVDLIFIW